MHVWTASDGQALKDVWTASYEQALRDVWTASNGQALKNLVGNCAFDCRFCVVAPSNTPAVLIRHL